MATIHSYELNGKKQSFANWISNLSPTETPFCSMTPKEAVNQTKFFWQTDRLAPVKAHAIKEGSDVSELDISMNATEVEDNVTQILRRAFRISDTANHMANFGRGQELPYQMEKFSMALKRDLEKTLLSAQAKTPASANAAGKTGCFQSLVAEEDATDADTGAKVHFKSGSANTFALKDLREMTYQLYLANSEADVIMFHPKHAAIFASLQSTNNNAKMFDGDTTTFSHFVSTYIDEFGREYKLVPNRWMPENVVYFFKPTDFTQMVLRAPQRVELGKEGNFTSWMLEMEVGLRLRDKFAAGVLALKA
ncbi:MAG: SU10 major capsid protein [Aeromonas popoffii]|uniref:SU10 major capsid protein n=1 Tax=Aeromonas popoffii TaxID=70856 RepID=UPI003F2CFDE1